MSKNYQYTIDSVTAESVNYSFANTTGGAPHVWTTDHTVPNTFPGWTTTGATITWTEMMDEDRYPKLPNALGVIYVEDGVIKCRTPEGEDIILGEMSEGDESVSIKIIATIAKKLLQKEAK